LSLQTVIQPSRVKHNNDTSISSRTYPEDGLLEMFVQAGDDITFVYVQDRDICDKVKTRHTMQQNLAFMLRATALSRLYCLKIQLELAVDELARRGRKLNHRSV